MKRILSIIALLFAVVYQAQAVPAYPHPVQYQLPDGSSVTVRVFGDEFYNYMLTSDGYQVTSLEDGFLYYYVPGIGTRSVSPVRVSEPSRRSAEERRFVSSLRNGVDPAYESQGRMAAEIRRSSMRINVEEFAPFTSPASKSASTRVLAARSLVILCQYKDVKFLPTTTKASFDNMLNQKGYSVNGAIGSANDYFMANSLGEYNPHFDVSEIVTLPEDMAFYGAPKGGSDDANPRQMIVDACKLAHAAGGINFSNYDADGDGVVEDIFVFYAGYNEAEGGPKNSIWPHRWFLNPGGSDMSIVLDGKTIDGYACSSELRGSSGSVLCGIGTFCHEFGHVLGLPDFYDTDYTQNGSSVGLYDVCVMSSGAYNNEGRIPPYYTGIERNLVGWNTMKDIKNADQNLTIHPIHTELGNDVWKIETGNPGEYFYLEARQATGWDQTLKNQGLLIYQIDRSRNTVGGVPAINRWSNNSLNAYANHPCARIVESGGSLTSDGNHGAMFYPGSKGAVSFLPGSYGFAVWNGNPLQIGLAGISQSNGTVSLRVVKELDLCTLSGTVKDVDGKVLPGAKISVIEIEDQPANLSSKLKVVSSPAAGVASRASSTIYYAVADLQGKYSLANLPFSNYTVMFESDGYDPHIETIELSTKTYALDAILNKFIPQLLSQVSWSKGQINGYLDLNQSIWVGSKWDAADLTKVVGKQLGGISVNTGSLTTYETRLIVNGQLKYTSKGSTAPNGLTLVYLPSQMDITVSSGDNVRVEFKVESAKSSIALDAGPAVEGKGNLFSSNGLNWANLSSEGITGNVKMALLYRKNSDVPEIPEVVAVAGQRTCELQFSSEDGNITVWNLRYKAAGGEWKEVNGIKTNSYIATGLDPETTYDAELKAVFGDKTSEPKTFQFTTTDLTSQFAGIGGVKSRYAIGESYTMTSVNIQAEVESIEWRWNGGVIRSESITFGTAGKGRLDCIITYKDGGKETLSREIVVQ